VEKFGLTLDMVQLPLASRPVEEAESRHILLGKDPERQRELASICRLIERIGAAGIPAAKYNFNLIGIPRTAHEAGRGGSSNAAFRWRDTDQSAAPGLAGTVSEDANWERIDTFLAAVVPVATAAKVRLACHPHDPYTPPGYKGVTRVLGTVAGLQRFVTMDESAYHGLNFASTVAEMLDDPAKDRRWIRWFGTRASCSTHSATSGGSRLHGGSGRGRHGHGAVVAGTRSRLSAC
jgi:mannonate dehydratase